MPTVRVEFYGLARLRAGREHLMVEAASVGEALAAADRACGNLHALCAGGLSAEYLLSIDGRQFHSNVHDPLARGSALLLMGADAGG
jgi:hypothetical protein